MSSHILWLTGARSGGEDDHSNSDVTCTDEISIKVLHSWCVEEKTSMHHLNVKHKASARQKRYQEHKVSTWLFMMLGHLLTIF